MGSKGMPARITALADQDFAQFTAMLNNHVDGIADLMDSEGYDSAEAFVRMVLSFEDSDQYDSRQVARMAAVAVVRLAMVRREIDEGGHETR